MTRLALALACLVVASAAFAAPVPKSLKVKHIQLTGCRPLLIRTAVVEDGELKLTGPLFAIRPADLETRSRPLKEVAATERDGRPIDADTLTARLKMPTLVVVVPVEEDDDPYSRENRPKADEGGDWRRVLAKDVIVIDGKAFKYGWWEGRYDVRLDPMTVDGRKVTTKWFSMMEGTRQWYEHECESTLDPDQLLEVNDQEWARWLRWVDRHRVEVNFRGKGELPDAYRELFLDEYLDKNTPHYKHPPLGPTTQRIHGGIL